MNSANTKSKTQQMPDGLFKRCPGYKDNFDTLCQAVRNEDVCLAACIDKATGKDVSVVCAVMREANGDYILIPLAKLFDGNPYEEIDPPGKEKENGEVKAKPVPTPG